MLVYMCYGNRYTKPGRLCSALTRTGLKKLEEEEEMLHTMLQVLLFYTLAPCVTFTHTLGWMFQR